MQDEYLVSIIVPVYNVSQYLDYCLASICNQTYSKIEIILIDDGSTDASASICDDWAEKDARIRVFHKNNGGLSDARNFGLANAKGDYVTFVDSDDAVAPIYVERLMRLVLDENADIAICDLLHCRSDLEIEYSLCKDHFIYSSEEAIVEMFYQKSFLVAACGKMFKSSYFREIRFPVGLLYEDSAIMYLLFEQASLICYEPSGLYAYFHRGDSITTRPFSNRDFDIWTICSQIEIHYVGHSHSLTDAVRAYAMSAAFRLFLNADDRFDLSEVESWIKSNARHVLLDKHARLKNRIAVLLYLLSPAILRRVYPHVDRWK